MKVRFIAFVFLLSLLAVGCADFRPYFDPAPPAGETPYSGERHVTVNQTPMAPDRVAALENAYSVRIENGDYWYDARSGLWGHWGGPAEGLILPRLDLGGHLPAHASGGGTGVFVNGRELNRRDVQAISEIVEVYQGRFWLDDRGNVGVEGMPAHFNILEAARSQGGGDNAYSHSSTTGVSYGSDGSFSYVMGKNWSYSSGS